MILRLQLLAYQITLPGARRCALSPASIRPSSGPRGRSFANSSLLLLKDKWMSDMAQRLMLAQIPPEPHNEMLWRLGQRLCRRASNELQKGMARRCHGIITLSTNGEDVSQNLQSPTVSSHSRLLLLDLSGMRQRSVSQGRLPSHVSSLRAMPRP